MYRKQKASWGFNPFLALKRELRIRLSGIEKKGGCEVSVQNGVWFQFDKKEKKIIKCKTQNKIVLWFSFCIMVNSMMLARER